MVQNLVAADHKRQNIPYDVWLHIASYLEPAICRNFIALNRAFLDTVLNDRYRNVNFSEPNVNNLHRFKRIQDEFVASRVRTLHLSISDLIIGKHGFWDKIKFALRGVTWYSQGPDYWLEDDIADRMAHIFRTLNGLTELTLYSCRRPKLHPGALSTTFNAWSILGLNLQTLMLMLPFKSIDQVLSPSLVFERLEVLRINIIHSEMDTDGERITSAIIIPFVNNHQRTLRSLTLVNSFWYSDYPTPTPLFQASIGHFPHLKDLGVSINSSREGIGIWHILGLHANRLKRLDITEARKTLLPLYNGPALSALVTLNLDPYVGWEYNSSIIISLQRVCTSLKSLGLRMQGYSCAELFQALGIFAQHNPLQSLSITFNYLSPRMIDFLSENLPGLQKLYIGVDGYLGDGDSPYLNEQVTLREEKFCEEMSRREYPNWGIQTFEINVYGGGLKAKECAIALKRLFPRIRVWPAPGVEGPPPHPPHF